MSEKIQAQHLEQAAYVYVRQSTMHQVREHQESQRRQYELVDKARRLKFRDVIVIDDDLGRSGSGSEERPGFGKLLAAVCDGQVGCVFALEASRLARNNRDWHHLIDLCALTDTLVVDHDGIYDPRQLNDRLLLGLKGSMAEFELGLLRQRGQEALREMIARGEALWEVAVGYVRRTDNGIEMIADRQVREAIRGVFAKFRELGTARQVLLWYRQQQIPVPHLEKGRAGSEIMWRLPIYNQILNFLQNPIYAGAFVHGRTTTRTVVRKGRPRKTHGHRVPMDQWEVLIRDHHPGYISWEEFLRNQEQLEANGGMRGRSGAAKSGPALLAGLLRCGRCGRNLHVGYSGKDGRVPRYYCRGAHINHGTAWCISFGGLRADEAVSEAVLDALEPAGVQAALDAWEQACENRSEKRKALELALEKATYEVSHARRQYDLVDPENRLVASELEARWNEALQKQIQQKQRLENEVSPEETLDESFRDRLFQLGEDLPAAWNHPAASVELKKRILRVVLTEIVVDINDEPPEIRMWLHWAGGVHTQLRVAKNRTGQHRRCTDQKVVDLVRELAKVCTDANIASILNRLGYRTGADNTWIESRVRSLRKYHQIEALPTDGKRQWLTLADAAKELEISTQSVRKFIKLGMLPAKQVVRHAPWVIERASLGLPAVQDAAKAIREGRRIPRRDPQQHELPLK
ncbi:MAG: recombinase family protein [Pirellulaceae bacterium]|jgi:DNA invertase Pin-like site-specific DNA recombinase|nr:recombinase family protein [Pirellulaceae bacterium]